MMNDFYSEYKKRIELIDSHMHECLESYNDCEDVLFDSMCYSVFNGGKRIRSILCMETARMLTGNEKSALAFATAIEFIHAFSLVHDDLPCMDNADLRRGMPSCHKKYGEAIALLAGDALLNTAFEVMADECEKAGAGAIKAMKSVGRAAGVHGMINGQIRDIELMASADATEEKLIRLIEQKTMALMMTSVESAALSCNADEDIVARLKEFAYNLGIAFQIRDDFEDEQEDMETEQNSPNFINTLGREKALSRMLCHADKAEEILNDFENNEFLKGLLDFLFGEYRN
jgi:geranylgeranyl diphosphate synthase type II